MFLTDLFRNYVNALVGRNQEFEHLLATKDIAAVKDRMVSRLADVIDALKESETKEHLINKREDKIQLYKVKSKNRLQSRHNFGDNQVIIIIYNQAP